VRVSGKRGLPLKKQRIAGPPGGKRPCAPEKNLEKIKLILKESETEKEASGYVGKENLMRKKKLGKS